MNTNGIPEIHTDFIFISPWVTLVITIAGVVVIVGFLIFLFRKKK
jgi:LPXTG-motif cell wall-anchored protein